MLTFNLRMHSTATCAIVDSSKVKSFVLYQNVVCLCVWVRPHLYGAEYFR